MPLAASRESAYEGALQSAGTISTSRYRAA